MKKLIALFLFSAVIGCADRETRIANIDGALDSLGNVYAPDHRTAVFQVSAKEYEDAILLTGDVDNPAAKDAVISQLNRLGETVVLDSIRILPEPALQPRVFGLVDVSVGNLYGNPRNEAELVDQVLLGHTVSVLKTARGGWYYVKSTPEPPLDKGYLGWIDSDNIVRIDSSTFASYNAGRKLLVTSVFSTLRTSPEGGPTLSDIVMGDFLTPVSSSGASFKVQLPDGRMGYVSKSDAQYYDDYMTSHKVSAEGIETIARRFLGFPYLWGGTSSKGLDCSGFVKTVFRMNGIDLPRDASQQAYVGDSVDPGTDFQNLKKGDLLFFGSKAEPNKPERIGHVGIYLGGGYFIHSSSLVRINSLIPGDASFDRYNLERFVKARRIL